MLYLSQIPAYLWLFFTIALIFLLVWVKFYFSDKNQTKIILNKVKKHFGFLFGYGFGIQSVDINGPNGAWSVDLKSEKCEIRLTQDRGDIYCEFTPNWANKNKHLDLSEVIATIENRDKHLYYPKDRNNIDSQFEFYGNLLNSHYESVIKFLESHSKPFGTANNI